jgi:hypothetical protein
VSIRKQILYWKIEERMFRMVDRSEAHSHSLAT